MEFLSVFTTSEIVTLTFFRGLNSLRLAIIITLGLDFVTSPCSPSPLVTIILMNASFILDFKHVLFISSFNFSFEYGILRFIPSAEANNLFKCSSKKKALPLKNLMVSYIPSPYISP